jgi:hypothetical protein
VVVARGDAGRGREIEDVTGPLELVSLPFPSWPALFCPQQDTLPSFNRAQLWALPAATVVAGVSSFTSTGVSRRVVVPSPSWREPFAPQHHTVL